MKHAPGRQAFVEPLESRLLMTVGELARNGAMEGTVSSADWVRGSAWQAGSLGFTNQHGGTGYAYNGTSTGAYINGTSGAAGSMYQQLTIPSNYVNPQLNFWTKITTQETTTTSVRDTMAVQVLDSSGNLLATLKTFSNLNSVSSTAGPYTATGKYALSTLSLAPYIGQTIRINFQVTTDATQRDDVPRRRRQRRRARRRDAGHEPAGRRLPPLLPPELVLEDGPEPAHLDQLLLDQRERRRGARRRANVNDANLATVVERGARQGRRREHHGRPAELVDTLAASATARAAFANNIKSYIVARNLDGVDIDWEPPATGANQVNYGLLIDDLYAALHPHRQEDHRGGEPVDEGDPRRRRPTKMDWVNVMCYDFDYANHSTYAASHRRHGPVADYGVAKDKLVMGMPFYGRSGTSWSDTTSYTYPTILNDYKTKNGSYPGARRRLATSTPAARPSTSTASRRSRRRWRSCATTATAARCSSGSWARTGGTRAASTIRCRCCR